MCSMVCGQRTPPSWTIDFNFFWLLHPTYSSFFWCIETGWFVRLNFWQKKRDKIKCLKVNHISNCATGLILLLSFLPGHRAGCRAQGSRAPSKRFQSGLRPVGKRENIITILYYKARHWIPSSLDAECNWTWQFRKSLGALCCKCFLALIVRW